MRIQNMVSLKKTIRLSFYQCLSSYSNILFQPNHTFNVYKYYIVINSHILLIRMD